MPAEMVAYVRESLGVAEDDVYVTEGPLKLPDLMALYNLDRPDLKDKPLRTTVPAALKERTSFFDAIRRRS